MQQTPETIASKLTLLTQKTPSPSRPPTCPSHPHYQQSLKCLHQNCHQKHMLFCQQCTHPPHHLYQVNRVVVVLAKMLERKWQDQVQGANRDIEGVWRDVVGNVRYCVDILREVERLVIEGRDMRVNRLGEFEAMVDALLNMYSDNTNFRSLQGYLQEYAQKYNMFPPQNPNTAQQQKYNSITIPQIDSQLEHRNKKWLQIGKKTKSFSQKALAFSQSLAQAMQDNFSYRESKNRSKAGMEDVRRKVDSLKEILQRFGRDGDGMGDRIGGIQLLKIQLPGGNLKNSKSIDHQKQEQIQSMIQKILLNSTKIQQIHINNKNGKISPKIWSNLITNFQYLQHLHHLNLTIRSCDLAPLTQLFTSRQKAVRQISILHLTISNDPQLAGLMPQLAQFCNTMQLRELYLNLPRNGITRKGFEAFVDGYRFRTSMTGLPVDVLEVSIVGNAVQGRDVGLCEGRFMREYAVVKGKRFVA